MNIVICDDEAPVRELMKSYILKQSSSRGTGSESQQTVLEYASGESLVRSLRASGEQIDILFLDISFGDGADGMVSDKKAVVVKKSLFSGDIKKRI